MMQHPPPRPKVLIIAEAANPEWVSVPLIGWSLANALREICDVHIVTQIRNRDAILRAGLIEGEDFTAIDSETFARPLWKLGNRLRMGKGKGWTMMQLVAAASYPYFERLVWQKFGPAICAGEYDLVHRITPLSPTLSSPIAAKIQKAGVPFILGPLNGGVPWPKGFEAERLKEREWLSYLRNAYKMLPARGATLAHASAILVGSRHTQGEIPAKHQKKCIYLPENAIDPNRFSQQARPENGPLRACFIGRMVAYKGPDILLEAAMPLLKQGRLILDIIGDGPLLASLKAQAAGMENVHFHGWVDHTKVQDIMIRNSLLAFPSIREFGGGVVLESMALGLVPLVVDYAGPGELVHSGFGFKIPIGDRATIVQGFRAQLDRIATDPGKLSAMGKSAKARVDAHFTWQAKASQIVKIYDWATGERSDRPDFFA
jgi:glycosyltransferase involved in cell wall biosynthesis